MADAHAPIGPRFSPPTRPRQGRPPGEPATATSPEQPATQPIEEPRGLRARAERLRDLAAGNRRPLGSPEGRGEQPRPSTTTTTGSSGSSSKLANPRKVVDATAVVIRQGSIWLDWLLGRRFPDADFVATAEESYAIAAPLAGELLEMIPEAGPVANVAERAGFVGAGIAAGTYLFRAGTGRPGGRAEAEALGDKVVRDLARAKKRRAEEPETAANPGAEAPEPPRTFASMLGLEGSFEGVGPA